MAWKFATRKNKFPDNGDVVDAIEKVNSKLLGDTVATCDKKLESNTVKQKEFVPKERKQDIESTKCLEQNDEDVEYEEERIEPWDTKKIVISFGGECDYNGYLAIEVFDDREFSIGLENVRVSYDGLTCFDAKGQRVESGNCFVEQLSLDALKRLRNFLNYALPQD